MEFTHVSQMLDGVLIADSLAWVMYALILCVFFSVARYSKEYLRGDRQYHRFFLQLNLIAFSALLMVFSDSLLLFFTCWISSNFLLVRLMTHKKQWRAAHYSGRLALATFAFGALMLSGAFSLLYFTTGSDSITVLTQTPFSPVIAMSLAMIVLAAMTQSAIWPFHKWLLSSLNSPTPVSALMHAGLVNGGGFLLVRFAPLYSQEPLLLNALFIIGLATAIAGIMWKLVQTDIKRMLACSTMGQMGFMVMQCGMGLFACAVSHLCWHGLFKAYLFLSSGSSLIENRPSNTSRIVSATGLYLSLVIGATGAVLFSLLTGKTLLNGDTNMLMIGFAWIVSSQSAITMLRSNISLASISTATVLSSITAIMYGGSIAIISSLLGSMQLSQPQPLNILHVMGFVSLFAMWLAMHTSWSSLPRQFNFKKRLYVWALNHSQPHQSTITAVRNSYQY